MLAGLIPLETLAKQLDRHPRTIVGYINEADGLPHIRLGRSYWFKPASVRTWLELRERRNNPRRGRAA